MQRKVHKDHLLEIKTSNVLKYILLEMIIEMEIYIKWASDSHKFVRHPNREKRRVLSLIFIHFLQLSHIIMRFVRYIDIEFAF